MLDCTQTELSGELAEVLGIEDFPTKRAFGRGRGSNPSPTEAQTREVSKLNDRISVTKGSTKVKKEDEEEAVEFNLLSKPRVILHESPLSKRSLNSIVTHSSRRYAFLLNDVMLITSVPSGSRTSIFSSVDRISLNQIIPLDQVIIIDSKKVNDAEDVCTFELRTNERPFIFTAESESDKVVWLEELESAVFAVMNSVNDRKLGWYHNTIRGTFHSAALLGDTDLVQKHIDRLLGSSLDVEDEAGMTPLHWAAMAGQLAIVQQLVDAGADVDYVNKGLNSSLLLASAFGREEVCMYLLESGADCYIRNMKDYDCLMMSVVFGVYHAPIHNVVFALKTRGVELNRQDISGATPLHEASSRNCPTAIQALVDVGADVNVKHGRTGLTPLQMACAAAEPDPETLRSLLDKGALPNWKDTLKRSAFDIVLHLKEAQGVASGDTSSAHGLRRTVEEVQDFVLICLPSLLEIVRKGGRYSPESILNLRQSFQEMIASGVKAWKDAGEPDNFRDYVSSQTGDDFLPMSWTADSASAACLLCLDKFTMSNRRHHCRSCGVLCCDNCSAKRLHIPVRSKDGSLSPAKKSGSSGSGGYEPERVCDGCFNRLVFECFQWSQAVARARKEQLRIEQQIIESRAKAQQAAPSSGKGSSSKKAGTETAQSAMSEAMKNMEERGEKLQQLADKSEQMREGASDFKEMTRQLLQQQQRQAGVRR